MSRRYLGHMTLIANQMGLIAGRRKTLRAFLESSAAWKEYSETYLKVGPTLRASRLGLRVAQGSGARAPPPGRRNAPRCEVEGAWRPRRLWLGHVDVQSWILAFFGTV